MNHFTNQERATSERRIIAHCLTHTHTISYCIARGIKPSTFSTRDLREVYNIIFELYQKEAPYWDYDAVKDRASNQRWYTGDEWLGDIAIEGPQIDQDELEFHVERLANYHASQTAAGLLRGLMSNLTETADPADQVLHVREVGAKLLEIAATNLTSVYHAPDLERISQATLTRIIESDNPFEADFEMTGFRALDELVAFPKGRVCVIAGRPSHGKTIMASEIALRAAKRFHAEGDGHVVFFSSEMNAREMSNRFSYNLGSISHDRILSRTATHNEVVDLKNAHKALGRLPLVLDTNESPTTTYLLSRLLELGAERNIRLAIWDYVEYTGEKEENKTRAIEEAVKGCHAIAKRLDIPFITLSQLSRGADKGPDGVPSLGDLAWSDALAKIPAVVIMIHHPWMSHRQSNQAASIPNPHDENDLWIHVKKNTHGGIGRVRLRINRDTVSIRDPDESVYDEALESESYVF